jgi:hypothetical protein
MPKYEVHSIEMRNSDAGSADYVPHVETVEAAKAGINEGVLIFGDADDVLQLAVPVQRLLYAKRIEEPPPSE